ncbi:winged helix-turn-helix domain-containing protein [Citricoccus nitrophenolicus]|uniref:Winged helix-turn-helix domain-containing protein n=1 Tax=Citricoccus nitrophenolicus TaxID=863575 RepID=A0ABV0IKA9_9MICC
MTEQDTAPTPGGGTAPAARTPVVISDPQAIRALAHEARLEALEELFASQSTRTATELASRCGLTPSAMSYHLRALEKYGFVERSPSEGDGRERRWKAAGYSLLVNSLNHSPASKQAFIDVQLNTFRDRIMKEVARREAEDQRAREAAERAVAAAREGDAALAGEAGPSGLEGQAGAPGRRRPPVLSTGMVFVNAEQRAEFQRRLTALIDEFEELNPASERSVDAERVYYLVSVLADAVPEPR